MTDTQPSIHDIANWFLEKQPMSHKKLQKLCYYAVAWGYTLMKKPIVKEPEFQAWVHGPVSLSLWNAYSPYGWNNIDKNDKYWLDNLKPRISSTSLSSDLQELLDSVWVTYGGKSGNELEALSHKELPWIKARGGIDESEKSSTPISSDDMKTYYSSIYIS